MAQEIDLGRVLGDKIIVASVAPTTRTDGNSLLDGDIWLNSNDYYIYQYKNNAWSKTTMLLKGESSGINTPSELVNLGILSYSTTSDVLNQVFDAMYPNGDFDTAKAVLFFTNGFTVEGQNVRSGYCLATPYGDMLMSIWDGYNLYQGDNSGINLVNTHNVNVVDLGTLDMNGGTLDSSKLNELNTALNTSELGLILKFNFYGDGVKLESINTLVHKVDVYNSLRFNQMTSGLSLVVVFEVEINLSNGKYIFDASGGRLLSEEMKSQISANTDDIADLKENKQDKLTSGTNIKTINNQSLLGSGNIDISGGSASKITNLGTLSSSGTLDLGVLQDLMANFQALNAIQATFMFNNAQYISANAYATQTAMGIIGISASDSVYKVVNLIISMTDSSYTCVEIATQTTGSQDIPIIDLVPDNESEYSGTLTEADIEKIKNNDIIKFHYIESDNQIYTITANKMVLNDVNLGSNNFTIFIFLEVYFAYNIGVVAIDLDNATFRLNLQLIYLDISLNGDKLCLYDKVGTFSTGIDKSELKNFLDIKDTEKYTMSVSDGVLTIKENYK